ncbi:MAG: UvrD-helicase domain-containing protein, partial [Desulfovibrio sp.]|nr:UvrD-helicase domain-containing protein [Desulfovibrio sp.]
MNEARTNEAMARLLKDACAALIDYKSESFLPKNSVVNGVTSLLDDALRGEFDNLPDRETIQRKLTELTNDFIANAKDFLDKCDSSGMDWHGSSRNSVEKLSKGAFTADIPACLQGDITKLAKKNAVIPAEVEKSYPSFIKDTERYYELAPILKDALLRQPLAKISALVAGAFKERLDMEAAVPAALIPHKANEVLHADNGVSDAVCRLGTRLSHILIDEFQDTGDDQWEALRPLALEALSRGGAFAYVGDVKQSIYGFRNGNPRLFTGVIEDMGLRAVADGGETDLLDENWRSGANIIDFNNRLFGIFEDKDSAKKVLR